MKIKNKKPNFEKLLSYGFKNLKDFVYEKSFLKGQFILEIRISPDGNMDTKVVEKSTGELYTLHLVQGVKGSFVGKIRNEYEAVISDIIENCFEYDVFRESLTLKIIQYAKEKYNDNPEYLWEKFPRNAVLRRKDNKKWYAAILTAKKCKIGISEGNEIAEIIDLRAEPEKIEKLIDKKSIYPGYHMNKKHWITIPLDGSMNFGQICKLIDTSYKLALK